jgi:hypothetical protein
MANYTTTNAPLPWMEPYLQDFMSRAQDVANQPYEQSPQTYTGPNDMLQQGWSAASQRAMQGSPVMGAANTLATNTMQGNYLNNNPYLDQSIANAQGDLTQAWNTVQKPAWDQSMVRSGSWGNTGVMEANNVAQDTLQKNLGRVATDMRSNAYNTERGLMSQAMGMAPTLANQDYVDVNAMLNAGQQAQTFNQGQADQNYKWWEQAQNYPAKQLGIYGQALGTGGNNGTQTQTAPDPSMASQLLGGGLTGAAIYKLLFPGP